MPVRAALVALLALAACGDNGDPVVVDALVGPGLDAAPVPRETVTRTVTLNAGAVREAEVRLNAPGDRVHARVMTTAPTLAWNVHTHNDNMIQTIVEGSNVDTIDYVISGTVGDYWLLLVNASGTLTFQVHLDLYGEAAYTGGL